MAQEVSKFEKALNIIKYKLSRLLKIELYGRLDYFKYKIYLYNAVRWRSCKKEPETTKWIEQFKAHDIVYDIGASVGPYSLLMSKYAKEVYAFEPAVFNFNLLTKNILYNFRKGFITNNVCPLNIALTSENKIGEFNYQSLDDGSSYHSLDSKVNPNGEFIPLLTQKIISISLDKFIEFFNAPVPTHIKIDVDGNEMFILEGAKKTLKDKKLKTVLIEVDKKNKEEILKIFKSSGFVLSEVSPRGENHIFSRP